MIGLDVGSSKSPEVLDPGKSMEFPFRWVIVGNATATGLLERLFPKLELQRTPEWRKASDVSSLHGRVICAATVISSPSRQTDD